MIDKTIALIENFPKDEKLRVVWAYGAVYKNTGTTKVPEIYVMLREIESSGMLSEKRKVFRKISVAQIDTVRYMTIWKGDRRTTESWKSFENNCYAENLEFSLDTNTAIPIRFKDLKLNSTFTYFPPYRYKIDNINNPKDYWKFVNATFTKMETNNGITVIVPSMELLTSTYTPQEQQIRYKLIQKNLDNVLDEYIKNSSTDGHEYKIELYENKNESNIAFLAYAKFNLISRKRILKLYSSLGGSYPNSEKYPIVLPYHPLDLALKGDGIWLDKKTFFMFRINEYSLPTENNVESYGEDFEFEIDESKRKTNSYTRVPQNLDDNEIPITNEHNPHRRNASQHIISEVRVLNPNNGSIKHKRQKLNILVNTDIKLDVENIENIDYISSAQSDETKDSKNIGGIIVDEQDKSHLKQSEVLRMVIESLEYMRDNKIDISDGTDALYVVNILFVDEECKSHTSQVATQFLRILKGAKKETNTWVKKNKRKDNKNIFLGYRNYMLLEILLSNGKSAYLFEIDRKDENESFLGMMFSIGGKIYNDILIEFLYQVMEGKGVVKKVKLPRLKATIFGHKMNKDKNLNNNIQSALKKATKNGLFC